MVLFVQRKFEAPGVICSLCASQMEMRLTRTGTAAAILLANNADSHFVPSCMPSATSSK